MPVICKTCGGQHPFWECAKSVAPVAKRAGKNNGAVAPRPDPAAPTTKKRGRPISDNPKSKRADYQRRLMQARRAAKAVK